MQHVKNERNCAKNAFFCRWKPEEFIYQRKVGLTKSISTVELNSAATAKKVLVGYIFIIKDHFFKNLQIK